MADHKRLILRLFHLVCFMICCGSRNLWAAAQNGSMIPINVGVVLDLEPWVGKLGWSCLNMALSDFYASNPQYRTRLTLHLREPGGDVIGAAAAAMDLIKNMEVQALIGPESSMQANFMIEIGNKSQIPIITFSATSPSLTSIRSPYFFRATKNDSSQVKPISAIIQAFGWRQVIPIYVDNEFGEGMIPFLTDALQEINVRVPYRSVISASARNDQIAAELYKLMTMQTRVFIVHMAPDLGTRVFAKAKEIGMISEGYVWIITDGMTNLWSEIDRFDIQSMQGVLGVKSYIPRSRKLESFMVRWKTKFHQEHPKILDVGLDSFGAWAYDAIFVLAMAAEKVGAKSFRPAKANVSVKAVDLQTLRVSENGPKIIQALSDTRFLGLAGDFKFVNGQLQSSAYQIININGRGGKGIGFWTPKNGLTRKLTSSNKTRLYSTSKDNLRSIIWPGDSFVIPKGWEIPTNGNKLKIGVPMKNGFKEFVSVSRDERTNRTVVEGYSIDVFLAAIEKMPYAISYKFIPFENSYGQMAGTYNDMICQVFLGNYDAVVGDTTIEANRSLFVDFTLPYTESGITMVVPIRDKKEKNAWAFLKPLTLDLWVTSTCFFVFIGFVVWVLEHRINNHFRGPPSQQVGTSLWFAFSTMLFAHRERVVSNLSRFVVIIWCFLVLILTQSYTASLTSLLTVQQLQPTVTDVNELLKSGANVGFQNGSFVEGILKVWKFDPLKFQRYNSADELDQMFSNGSIAAAVDEKPYMKLFLAKYCNKYTTVELPFKTNGFGFVFPNDSPLVSDISRAILSVAQSDKIKEIEDAWIRKGSTCTNPSPLVSSNSLGLESFWGLFLIAGVVAIFALFMFAATFLLEHRRELSGLDAQIPIWMRFRSMARMFDEKDMSSHVFRKTAEIQDKNDYSTGVSRRGTAQLSPIPNYPASPSSDSQDKNSSSIFLGDQEAPSEDQSDPSSLENGTTTQLADTCSNN